MYKWVGMVVLLNLTEGEVDSGFTFIGFHEGLLPSG